MTTLSDIAVDDCKPSQPTIDRIGLFFCGLFGVLLPLVTLGVELCTRMCAEIFDPIPTPLHVGAIALVAVTNLLTLRALHASATAEKGGTWLAQLNAAAMGVGLFYSLWFAVLTPFAVVAVIFFGIGLLPLAPLLSLIVTWFLRCRLRRMARTTGSVIPGVWLAFFTGFGGLVALEMPGLAQAWAVATMAEEEIGQTDRAMWVLRHAVTETQLLRGCYSQLDGERDAVHGWLFGRTSLEKRQKVYYRVTGRPFNHRPAPERGWGFPGRGRSRDTHEWIWDNGLGGDAIGQRLKALTLIQSRLDGSIDGNAALGYLEWTLVFRNDHEFQQHEARALVQLPAGAVVSRLTLWIDGEEREAAFGGRSQVRQAYQAVVSQRRDPVLVTAKGPDRVLVQCFPIEPKGKEMKIRLGITLPLVVDGQDSARFVLPRVIEQNYSAAPGLTHTVWIESSQALSSGLPAYRTETPRSARHALCGELNPADFGSAAAGVVVKREPLVTGFWTQHPLDAGNVITQDFVRQAPPTGPVSIVLDGSADLASVVPVLADELARLPVTFPVRLSVAGDTVLTCPATDPRAAADWLRAQEFIGGQDATAALQAAIDGLGAPGGTLLWIHGMQPITWQNTAALEQNFMRRAGRIRLLALSAVPGPNLLLEKVAESPDLVVLPRLGYFKEDLIRTLDRLQNGSLVAVRKVHPAGGKTGTEVSSHLARLWAAEEVARLLAGGQGNREAAVSLAVKMQLVTAMSGAVVLENKQQYDAAGLQAVDPKTVPKVVPDGGSVLLMLATGLVLLHVLARRRGTLVHDVAASIN